LDLLVAEGAVSTDGINAALEARRQNADGTVVRQRIIVLVAECASKFAPEWGSHIAQMILSCFVGEQKLLELHFVCAV
jgi:hypothetical protein